MISQFDGQNCAEYLDGLRKQQALFCRRFSRFSLACSVANALCVLGGVHWVIEGAAEGSALWCASSVAMMTINALIAANAWCDSYDQRQEADRC